MDKNDNNSQNQGVAKRRLKADYWEAMKRDAIPGWVVHQAAQRALHDAIQAIIMKYGELK